MYLHAGLLAGRTRAPDPRGCGLAGRRRGRPAALSRARECLPMARSHEPRTPPRGFLLFRARRAGVRPRWGQGGWRRERRPPLAGEKSTRALCLSFPGESRAAEVLMSRRRGWLNALIIYRANARRRRTGAEGACITCCARRADSFRKIRSDPRTELAAPVSVEWSSSMRYGDRVYFGYT